MLAIVGASGTDSVRSVKKEVIGIDGVSVNYVWLRMRCMRELA